MPRIFDSILDAVGNTPLVRLRKVAANLDSEILVKCEFLNPSGSLKDRVAKYMIQMAEKECKLAPGHTIVEASTGNMGSALAMAAAVRGYKFTCFMPETATEERSKIMKLFGAKVRLTAPLGPGEPIVHRKAAQEMEQQTPNVWWSRQFSNIANLLAHKETTGYEIVEQTDGKIDAFVASVGSGGTLMGVAHALKEKLSNRIVKIIAVEPESSPMLSKGKSGYHAIPGISDGFIPELLDIKIYDRVVLVSDRDAMAMTHRLHKEEGLFCGVSSGANVVACIEIARELAKQSTIVTVLPDSADRYFSMETYEV